MLNTIALIALIAFYCLNIVSIKILSWLVVVWCIVSIIDLRKAKQRQYQPKDALC
jgi:hypothetical protein